MMRKWLSAEIARRRAASDLGSDMMGALLGDLDDEAFVEPLEVLVGEYRHDRQQRRQDHRGHLPRSGLEGERRGRCGRPCAPSRLVLGGVAALAANPILLRQAAATKLGTVDVRAGDKVIAWSQAAMLDASAFPNPLQLRPDRPAWTYPISAAAFIRVREGPSMAS
jgi:hypothetical protein